MTYLITIALHLCGLALGLRSINRRTPKRWTPGMATETRLNGKHRVRWIPLD